MLSIKVNAPLRQVKFFLCWQCCICSNNDETTSGVVGSSVATISSLVRTRDVMMSENAIAPCEVTSAIDTSSSRVSNAALPSSGNHLVAAAIERAQDYAKSDSDSTK